MDRVSQSVSTADRETALLELAIELSRELHPARRLRRLTPDSSIERDAGVDSLARIELLLRVEKRLGMRLPDHAVLSAETFRDLLAAIDAAPAGTLRAPPEGPALESGTNAEEEWPESAETLIEALEWHAQRHPDRAQIHYLADGEMPEAITHGELSVGSRRIAAGLRALDLEPGRTVAIMLPSGRPYFETFMGILMASGVAVPLYPPTRIHRLEEHVRRQVRIMANAQASVLVTFDEAKKIGALLKSLLPGLRAIVTPAELAREPGGGSLHARSGDLAFLQYTSGSTGDPKGVMLTHANLLANIRAMIRGCGATPAETFVSWLPLYHDMGLIGAWLGVLCAGARLVLMSPLGFMGRPVRWLRAISAWKGTLSAAPNFAYEICATKLDDADLRGLDLSSWRVAFNGAEPVHPETLERFATRFAPYGFRREALAPVYGLAENSVGVTFPPMGRGPRHDRVKRQEFLEKARAEPAGLEDARALTFVGCGSPLTTVEVRIVDEAGREAPDRVQGRVEFRGPSATAGYYRNAASTRRMHDRGWIDSGDLGYMAGGELFLTGRTKDVIIRGGRNIHPQEIEEAVGSVSGIRLGFVAVFGARDARSGAERLIVAAETRVTQREIREKIVSKICDLSTELLEAAPDDIVLVPPGSVPKTPSGKLRRGACRELYERGELGQKRLSPGLQVARLALSGLAPGLARAARATGRILYAVWSWGTALAVSGPLWLAIASLPGLAVRRAVLQSGVRFWLRITGIHVSAAGLSNIPVERPSVLVPNHASYLDSFVLAAVLPPRFVFLAKKELDRSAFLSIFLRRLGTIFAERASAEQGVMDAAAAVEAVRAGQGLVVYPEGTFRRAAGLRPFKLGAFLVAARAGVPLLPITIRGMRSILRDGQKVPRPGRVSISIGTPLTCEGEEWNAAIKLRARARAEILRGCGEPDLIEAEE
ncbi:MAG TPA: AMP-binding protein [Terrimicrobiaceae bacterium]